MRNIKMILVLAIATVFTLAAYSSAEARDCSNPKGFHEKLACKLKGDKPVAAKNETNDNGELYEKIKKFLGKKNNEVTGN